MQIFVVIAKIKLKLKNRLFAIINVNFDQYIGGKLLITVHKITLKLLINPILESNGLHLPNDMLAKILLYGNDIIRINENKTVLTATLKFILKSTRFDLV